VIYSVKNSVISERGGSYRLRFVGGGGGVWSCADEMRASIALLDLLRHVRQSGKQCLSFDIIIV